MKKKNEKKRSNYWVPYGLLVSALAQYSIDDHLSQD
jgi:invasion protein IalB